VHDLIIDGEFTAFVFDDEHTKTATAAVESIEETLAQITLVNHTQALLHVSALSHADDSAVISVENCQHISQVHCTQGSLPDVQHAVRLVDWAEHILHSHWWARVADEAGLLIELLSEEIHTQVAVLAGLCRSSDADDLARATLKNHDIADADEMARDSDSVLHATTTAVVVAIGSAVWHLFTWSTNTNVLALWDVDVLFYVDVDTILVVMMVMAAAVDGVQDAVSSAVKALTERVVLSLVVVIAHITLVLAVWSVVWALGYFDLFVNDFAVSTCSSRFTWVGVSARLSVLLGERNGTVTVLSLGDVDVCVDIDLGCWGVAGVVLAVLDVDVDLLVDVPLGRLTVARWQPTLLVAVPWLEYWWMVMELSRDERWSEMKLGREEKWRETQCVVGTTSPSAFAKSASGECWQCTEQSNSIG
jgi:hypothetical protein